MVLPRSVKKNQHLVYPKIHLSQISIKFLAFPSFHQSCGRTRESGPLPNREHSPISSKFKTSVAHSTTIQQLPMGTAHSKRWCKKQKRWVGNTLAFPITPKAATKPMDSVKRE